jgi:hypothetical protein
MDVLANIKGIVELILQYKGYIVLASGWFIHVYYPYILQIYPFVVQNGGLIGLVKKFFFGNPPQPPTPQ